MKMNKGDVILICILLATLMFFAVNEFNILAGLTQFDGSFTTLFGIIFGGELLSFAIYKIGSAKYESQQTVGLARYIPGKNTEVIQKVEAAIEEYEDEQAQKGKHANEQVHES